MLPISQAKADVCSNGSNPFDSRDAPSAHAPGSVAIPGVADKLANLRITAFRAEIVNVPRDALRKKWSLREATIRLVFPR